MPSQTNTPSGATIILRDPEGNEHDVTDAVGAIYDLLASSMDWGSDFLSVEDAKPFVQLVDLAGYKDPDPQEGEPMYPNWDKGPRPRPELRNVLHGPSMLQQARRQVAAAEGEE